MKGTSRNWFCGTQYDWPSWGGKSKSLVETAVRQKLTRAFYPGGQPESECDLTLFVADGEPTFIAAEGVYGRASDANPALVKPDPNDRMLLSGAGETKTGSPWAASSHEITGTSGTGNFDENRLMVRAIGIGIDPRPFDTRHKFVRHQNMVDAQIARPVPFGVC